MDLIYMNKNREDVNVMKNFTFDLAFGYDENNFELKTDTGNHVCSDGYYLYLENTEYGGVIDSIRVKTATKELVYKGRTWHGVLASKILAPDEGEDYLILTGEANQVLGDIVIRLGLGDLFAASTEDSGITINAYQMPRYINGYDGLKKVLETVGCKLKISFIKGFVTLSAEPLIDYSKDDEFDSSQLDFDIEKHYRPINHVICLGKGELKERQVAHLYTDAEGNISHVQSLFDVEENTAIYENANAESVEELEQGGVDLLKEAWNADALQLNLDSAQTYDIGDVVGAREVTTGIFIARAIIKKIVKIERNVITISHKVGE